MTTSDRSTTSNPDHTPEPSPEPSPDLVAGSDGVLRCPWAASSPLEQHYHDTEWGRELTGEREMFERIVLEAFQAGLSWRTVLNKREALRRAFVGFDVDAVASMSDDQLDALMADESIIRNRAKIRSARTNAIATIALRDGDGLNDLIWSFAPSVPTMRGAVSEIPAVTAESEALANALKRAGFSFVGPTTAYALMQAVGMVNDHLIGCHRHDAG
ncbi:MAG TPA: DNA-3-methyladenine glycosylase I [Microthrixaceae bacterium]|nr:DNA-3-methyladenine glycosylase I [Microthrixaceae bacterium]